MAKSGENFLHNLPPPFVGLPTQLRHQIEAVNDTTWDIE